MPRAPQAMTTIEMMMALAILAILAGLAVPRFSLWHDAIAVRNGVAELVSALGTGRALAIRRARPVGVKLGGGSTGARVLVLSGEDTLLVRDLGELYGLSLISTRDSTAYTPLGLGYGGANARIILSRGRSADTVYVSREGRVRH